MAEQAKLEDSNMANYGGDEHRAAAKAAAESDPQWAGAGSKTGLEIWRVENVRTDGDKPNFGVQRWPKEQYGEFFDGDSYIVLHTYKKRGENALLWDVHFWLGKDTTQDEKGVAAYKTVELDDLLDDGPVQHRETMGNETPLFQSYFKSGISYLSGGIASGFRKVKPEEYVPRLLEVRRAKKTTRARQVECAVSSMNKGDCYILDLGQKVYKYMGPNASPFEKSRCANLCANMITGRQGKSREVNIEDDEDFWTTLGGTEADVADAISAEDKAAATSAADAAVDKEKVKMFRISEVNGDIFFKEVEKGDKGYTTVQLDTGDVFVVDSGIEIFIWRGKGSSKGEKNMAWSMVDKYIENNGIPSNVPVTVIDEGKVNTVFHSLFAF
eukprot:snap_masked-scaffold_6-processed-gene-14.22-mRNA-1 protein AED:0.15 eAED:0.15 QI:0/-1/0/1/-1/1/1/0/383